MPSSQLLSHLNALDRHVQRVIYHLLDQVAELMAGSAPRVEEEVVVGEAQVLQTFALKKGTRCGVQAAA